MKTVAIQGITGSYSEEAAKLMFGESISCLEYESFEATFSSVITGVAECAVVPLKNRILGEITSAKKQLRISGLRPGQSLNLKVQHVLAAIPETDFESITEVLSHPEALKQCRRFFEKHERILPIAAFDTASSIKDVIEQGFKHRAAICSERAAHLFNAKIICRNIADDTLNQTTFYAVGPR